MKTIKIFSLIIFLITINSFVFSQQCPPSVLKIQSPICDTPSNLRVSNIKCATIQLNWQGNKEQKYIVEATGTDNAANILFEVKQADYNCDEGGNCAATVSVKQGANLKWNVQAICNINGVTIYSPKIEAKEMVIPYCHSITADEKTAISKEAIRVYPNPTTGYLNIEYYSKSSGTAQIKVIDVNGKTIYTTAANTTTGNNSYTLNLKTVLPGTYLLELSNNQNISKAKFVLVRK